MKAAALQHPAVAFGAAVMVAFLCAVVLLIGANASPAVQHLPHWARLCILAVTFAVTLFSCSAFCWRLGSRKPLTAWVRMLQTAGFSLTATLVAYCLLAVGAFFLEPL